MKCERETLASAYFDGELDAATSAQLEAHLGSCESCRTSIADHRALGAAIKERADYFAAPESLREPR
jgi:anti-sigma factor RsiW